jgi:hypothetical protein
MYRAPLARSFAAIFTTLSLLGAMFVPVVASAFANECKVADTMCNKDAALKGSYCFCVPPESPTFVISGYCHAVQVCQGTIVTGPDGIAHSLSGYSNSFLTDTLGLSENAQTSVFGQIGQFMKENPLISGLGMGLGMSLLQSLMSGSGGSGSSGANNPYSNGACTTQYYYTSDPNALADPCAIYNPGAGNGAAGTNTTDNGLSGLLNNLNSSNSPGISIPTSTAGSISPYSPLSTIVTSNASATEPSITIATPDTGMTNAPIPVSDLLNNTQYYSNTTDSSTLTPAQTPLNQNPVPVPTNGLHGDILSFGGGVTIYASSRSGNTEISGFYGANGAGTSQSIGGRLCQSRPWAQNFLSYVIPPTFFDNLCSWGGYPVGVVQIAGSSGGGSTGGRGGGSSNTSMPAPQSNTPYSNPVQAQAKIWARPASVSLGGRTTIFWTSQNVSACTESSSDGNFSGNTTSGGASTVALSGATTFTIKCQTVDGKTVSDSTTVPIGI